MITVSISINGEPIFARTAVNRTKELQKGNEELYNSYVLDDGSKILHNPKEGGVKLAIKMLETIKEVID